VEEAVIVIADRKKKGRPPIGGGHGDKKKVPSPGSDSVRCVASTGARKKGKGGEEENPPSASLTGDGKGKASLCAASGIEKKKRGLNRATTKGLRSSLMGES